MNRFTCDTCHKSYKNKNTLGAHQRVAHGKFKTKPMIGEQTGQGPTIAIVPKSVEEIANNHLDNNKDLYDEEEWKNLKHKFREVSPGGKDPRKNKCKYCSKKFLHDRELAIHIEEQHPICIHCRKRFNSKKEFEKHSHPTCQVCGKVELTDKALAKHFKIHPKCQECGENFINQAQLKIHEMHSHPPKPDHSHTPSESPTEEVPTESPTEESEDTTVTDEDSNASTISAEKGLVPVNEEEASMSDASTLSAGKEVIPYEVRTREIPSDRSSVKTVSEEDVSEKRKKSKKNKKKPWEKLTCHLCNKKFISEQLLTKHMDDEHSYPDGLKVKCPKCSRKFASKRLLDRHIKEKHPQRLTRKDRIPLPKPAEDVYECHVCNRILKTKEGYLEHIRNHRIDCKVCAAYFNTTAERDIHMSMEHPKCVLCDIVFLTTEEYMKHKAQVHPQNQDYGGPDLPTESEDELQSDESSLDGEDRMFHKHIDCVTIEKFLEIRELIEQNKFETLINDDELVEALQIIFKGVIKGYIPLCSPQRLIMTKQMKKLMFTFGASPSTGLLMRNKKTLKHLFKILWDSVKLVIDNYMKFVQN